MADKAPATFAGIVALDLSDLSMARRLYGEVNRGLDGSSVSLSFHPDVAGYWDEDFERTDWTTIDLTEAEARELHADLGELLGGRLES